MISEYIQKAIERAEYKKLAEVLEEWLLWKIKDDDDLPEIVGKSLRIGESKT